eukprot:GHVS01045137.1.p1 GENE.GHVS01045137.1~~GHVS01045137.1.p1  ORF type:complete len:544 (+),score=67.10 GHVS01045137.1:206-1837(+)
MLNVDGVVLGRYRGDANGVDLNRVWHSPSQELHPTIYFSKLLLQSYCSPVDTSSRVRLFCDFHGHSRKRDVFLYANESTSNPRAVVERHPSKKAGLQHAPLQRCSAGGGGEIGKLTPRSRRHYKKLARSSQQRLHLHHHRRAVPKQQSANNSACGKSAALNATTRGSPESAQIGPSNRAAEVQQCGSAIKGAAEGGSQMLASNAADVGQLGSMLVRRCRWFSMLSCRYRDALAGGYKEGAARVVACKEMFIPHSYTLECSLFGPSTDPCSPPLMSSTGAKQQTTSQETRIAALVSCSAVSTDEGSSKRSSVCISRKREQKAYTCEPGAATSEVSCTHVWTEKRTSRCPKAEGRATDLPEVTAMEKSSTSVSSSMTLSAGTGAVVTHASSVRMTRLVVASSGVQQASNLCCAKSKETAWSKSKGPATYTEQGNSRTTGALGHFDLGDYKSIGESFGLALYDLGRGGSSASVETGRDRKGGVARRKVIDTAECSVCPVLSLLNDPRSDAKKFQDNRGDEDLPKEQETRVEGETVSATFGNVYSPI